MREYNVTDEDRFDAEPSTIFRALLDESAGKTHWWAPALELHPKSGVNGEVGSTFEIEVHNGPRPVRWSGRVTERVDDQLLSTEFTDGDFLGEGIWTVDRIDGQTRLRYRFHVRPHGIAMRLSAPFLNVAARHSAVMRRGFAALHGFLEHPAV